MIWLIYSLIWFLSPKNCYQQLANDRARCAIDFPNATSIGRQYCEQAALNAWSACIDSHGWRDFPNAEPPTTTIDEGPG